MQYNTVQYSTTQSRTWLPVFTVDDTEAEEEDILESEHGKGKKGGGVGWRMKR